MDLRKKERKKERKRNSRSLSARRVLRFADEKTKARDASLGMTVFGWSRELVGGIDGAVVHRRIVGTQFTYEKKEQTLRFAQNDRQRLEDPRMTTFRECGGPASQHREGCEPKGRSVTERRRDAALKTAALHKNLVKSLSRRG